MAKIISKGHRAVLAKHTRADNDFGTAAAPRGILKTTPPACPTDPDDADDAGGAGIAASVNGRVTSAVNGDGYDPASIPVTGTLGTTDEWNITASPFAPHMFHIHINKFRIMDIKNGKTSIFDANGDCNSGEETDTEHCHLKSVVRDTLFIKAGYTLTMRTVYDDYTGEFVMHCHILDHEDRGMMENVQVVTKKQAMLQRLTSPITAMSKDANRWLARLRGEDETKLALASSLCSARDYARR